jgi:hypothetical protein
MVAGQKVLGVYGSTALVVSLGLPSRPFQDERFLLASRRSKLEKILLARNDVVNEAFQPLSQEVSDTIEI